MKRLKTLLLLGLFVAFAGMAAGGDAADFTDAFDFSSATKPRPGDWAEYLVAFPADPLERELSGDAGGDSADGPGAVVERDASAPPEEIDFDALMEIEPVFEPAERWTTVPVRLNIREVDDAGCNAEITFAGVTNTVRLDAGGERAEFSYDAGGDAERSLRIGGREYAVRELRREGPGYGFVRWFSPEIPFGTVRFATGQVDMQLVGFGRGTPPDFPVRPEDEVEPALGALY